MPSSPDVQLPVTALPHVISPDAPLPPVILRQVTTATESAESRRGGNLWDAPRPSGPLDAVVEVPGSKSQTNRLLLLAALAESPSVIHGALRSRDTDLMITALNALGAQITPGTIPATLEVLPIPSLRDSATTLRSAQNDRGG